MVGGLFTASWVRAQQRQTTCLPPLRVTQHVAKPFYLPWFCGGMAVCAWGAMPDRDVHAVWCVYSGGASVDGDLLGRVLRKRIKMMGTTLRARPLEYKAALVKAFETNALPHFDTGKFKAVVDTSYPLAQAAGAHEYMEANKNVGKIILRIDEDLAPSCSEPKQ